MSESTARIGIYASDNASPVVTSVQGKLQGLAAAAKSSILTGVGLGTGIAAFGLLQRAVGGVFDSLGDMVQAAINDEQSISRLTQSLKANVPAWDGSTKAIEARILASQRLGFTDDELRASLTVLVGATHDVSKAQELQNTAMDLARFKGIDLGTATDALVKVEGGRYRILASLGIVMREGATATEVLAAVQKVAAGQAQAFGDTTAGAMAAAAIAFEELKEDIGKELMPVMTELARFALDSLIPAIKEIGGAIGDVIGFMGYMGQAWATAGLNFGEMGDKLHQIADDAGVSFDTVKDRVARAMLDMGMSFADASEMVAGEMGVITTVTAEGMRSSREEAATGMADIRTVMAGGMKTAMEATILEVTSGGVKIGEETKKIPPQMASALLAGQFSLENAAAELLRYITEGLTPMQERAQALAWLASGAYAQGWASGKPAAIAYVTETRNAAIAVLGQTGGAFTGGMSLATAWRNGLLTAMEQTRIMVIRQMGQIKALMYGYSPPKEGPLKDIDKGGENIGKAWSAGLVKGVGTFKLPNIGMPGVGRSEGGMNFGGGIGGGGGRGAPVININIHEGGFIDGPSVDRLANLITQRLRYAPGT